ncbi:MAG: TerC family protein [Peptococcaceae bacterium]|nr:TerC family protein [Peptococcaceae bacterium]
MEILTLDFLSKVLAIVLIDLVLGGDNAIVIGMAARNLPRDLQKKAVICGTIGAVVVRISATFVVLELLALPGVQLVGGLLLLWIAYKLLLDDNKEHKTNNAHTGFLAAIGTIMVADISMGMDNIVAVAGAAHSDFSIVVFGLLISLPIIVWGSTLIIRLIDRFPVIVFLGAALIAYTGGSMMMKDILTFWIKGAYAMWQIPVAVGLMALVLIIGKIRRSSLRE